MQWIFVTFLFSFLLANAFGEATMELMEGNTAILSAGTEGRFR
jgi:hypothetical protein